MPQTATYLLPATRPVTAPPRELIWIQEPHFLGWGCSQCAWRFKPSGPPVGNSLQEMKDNYLRLRDEESAAHVCAEHPRVLHLIPQRGTRHRAARQGQRAGSRRKERMHSDLRYLRRLR
jgi:hypothetical protein